MFLNRKLLRIFCRFAIISASWVASLFYTSQLLAQQRKHALVVDFKNRSGNTNLDYLEASITDAIRKELKEKYSFQELPPEKWKDLAKANFIYEKDWHTDTAAMNLGLLTRQDVVVGGSFTDVAGQNHVVVSVNIYDINRKTKNKEITIFLNLSSQMFKDIDELSKKAAKAAEDVLPNKEEWGRLGLESFTISKANQVSASFTSGVFAKGSASGALDSTSLTSPDDFSLKLGFLLQYRRNDLWRQNYFGWAHFGYETSSQSFDTSAAESITGKMSAMQFALGGGYLFHFSVRMNLGVYAGAGYYMGKMKYDYSAGSVIAINSSTSQIETGKDLKTNAPQVLVGTRFSYRLIHYLSLQYEVYYAARLFQNATGHAIYNAAGVSYDF